jgi:hypothetical protein
MQEELPGETAGGTSKVLAARIERDGQFNNVDELAEGLPTGVTNQPYPNAFYPSP